MPELNQNFDLYKDSHLSISFVFTDYNPLEATAIWTMSDLSGSVILTKQGYPDITLFEDRVVVSISPSDTADMPIKRYVHELRLKNAQGLTSPVALGNITMHNVLTASNF